MMDAPTSGVALRTRTHESPLRRHNRNLYNRQKQLLLNLQLTLYSNFTSQYKYVNKGEQLYIDIVFD